MKSGTIIINQIGSELLHDRELVQVALVSLVRPSGGSIPPTSKNEFSFVHESPWPRDRCEAIGLLRTRIIGSLNSVLF